MIRWKQDQQPNQWGAEFQLKCNLDNLELQLFFTERRILHDPFVIYFDRLTQYSLIFSICMKIACRNLWLHLVLNQCPGYILINELQTKMVDNATIKKFKILDFMTRLFFYLLAQIWHSLLRFCTCYYLFHVLSLGLFYVMLVQWNG